MKQNSQQGSAVMWILVAVGLFAALGFAFNNSNRTSTSLLSNEEASTYANQVIAHGAEVKAAVKRLYLRGCSDTEISFENGVETNTSFVNANAPSSRRCHVFDPAGAGLTYWDVPERIQEPNVGLTAFSDNVIFFGSDVFIGHGSDSLDADGVDLALYILVSAKVCKEINQKLNIPYVAGTSPVDQGEGINFTGTYTYNARAYGDGGTTGSTDLAGESKFCYLSAGTLHPVFVQLLHAR